MIGSESSNKQAALTQRQKRLNDTLEKPLSTEAAFHAGIGSDVYHVSFEDYTVYVNDSRYAYIDISTTEMISAMERVLYDLELAGYYPVILYPEQADVLLTHEVPFYRLVRKGCLGMVSAASIVGRNRSKTQMIAMNMIRGNLAHFIHSPSGREEELEAAYAKVESKIGKETASSLRDNHRRVLADDHVEVDLPDKLDYMKKPKWRLFG
ncbi:CpsB/CapC family capsule biosynthesis tyrosine phosphatase [Sinobaca sp. H24]|uniref:CpsB/CapC family capsule biosynthesis tyrosine phosphatase n=1 Tax=Sinobaca sp. H24 TaxID=2923376 RepID=UPI00207958E3|nr:CpsB/CapC family capsule biosynthesis tyrosine phosphatase [Sinobaca sp. H24]